MYLTGGAGRRGHCCHVGSLHRGLGLPCLLVMLRPLKMVTETDLKTLYSSARSYMYMQISVTLAVGKNY